MQPGCLRRCDQFIWRDIGGEVVILNEAGTKVCLLNTTAAYIWTLADGTLDVTGVTAKLCERFEVALDQALADVQEMSGQLVAAGLAEWRPRDAAGEQDTALCSQ
jgi:hypothetical protein